MLRGVEVREGTWIVERDIALTILTTFPLILHAYGVSNVVSNFGGVGGDVFDAVPSHCPLLPAGWRPPLHRAVPQGVPK